MPKGIKDDTNPGWKRKTSNCCRTVRNRSRKPVDVRKRKRKVTKIAKEKPAIEMQETSVILEDIVRTSSAPISSDDESGALSNVGSSTISKINNGALSSLTNGTADDNCSVAKNTSALFHSLCYSEDVLSALPNRTWAIHSTETPEKRIVVSAMMMHNFHDAGLAPVYVKQIVFDERLNFDILLVNSRYVLKDKPTSIGTMHDFEDLLDYVDSLKICNGGPPISQYSHINPECAYKDSMNNWRHNLCTLEMSNNNFGDVCESCRSLDDVLRRHAQRTKSAVKSRKR